MECWVEMRWIWYNALLPEREYVTFWYICYRKYVCLSFQLRCNLPRKFTCAKALVWHRNLSNKGCSGSIDLSNYLDPRAMLCMTVFNHYLPSCGLINRYQFDTGLTGAGSQTTYITNMRPNNQCCLVRQPQPETDTSMTSLEDVDSAAMTVRQCDDTESYRQHQTAAKLQMASTSLCVVLSKSDANCIVN